MLGRLALAARVLVYGVPKPMSMPNGARMWGAVPDENTVDEELQRSTALSLLDPDVIGYVLLTVRREFTGPNAEVRIANDVVPELLPAVTETMRRFIHAAREVVR